MSYCRFSSDNFQCDVYVYAHCGNWYQVEVASRRDPETNIAPDYPHWVFDGRKDDYSEAERVAHWDEYQIKYKQWSNLRESDDYPWVDLTKISSFAGKSMSFASSDECASMLERLREDGLIVPQYAIDCLREEDDNEVFSEEPSY